MEFSKLVELHEESGQLGTFDYAIPKYWSDHFWELMGEFPYGFVWSYPAKSIWGEPYAVTAEAKKAFAEYIHRGGMRS